MLMYFSIYLEILNHSVVELPQKLLLCTVLVNEPALVCLSLTACLSIGVRAIETAFFCNGFYTVNVASVYVLVSVAGERI